MMSKLVHFVFFLSIALHVIARATESSESDTMESSRSSSSEEMRYNEDLEDLVKVDAGNSTIEEVKDSSENSKKSGEIEVKKADKPAAENDLEKFDKGLNSDKKEYVQKRSHVDSISTNSTENLSDDEMDVMAHLNKTMDSEEDMQKNNETVLGIDTFGAPGI